MYQPTGLQKIFVQDMKTLPQRKLSKLLIAYFGVAQLCFGFNLGFASTTSGKFNTGIKLITTIMGCVMMVTLSLQFTANVTKNLWMIIYFIQYIPLFLILMSVKYPLCEFISDIIETNENSEPPKYDKVGLMTWLYTSLLFVIKISASMIYYSLTTCTDSGDSHDLMIVSLLHIPILALDIVPVANCVLLFYVYERMNNLKIKFDRKEIDVDTLRNTYKAVADSLDKFKSSHDAMFVWGFLTESPKWIFLIWNNITLMKSSNSWLLYTCSSVWAFTITVAICVPAVFAEMINVQTDAMKLILLERLHVEKDDSKTMNLLRVLRYIEARPLLQKAWRLLPLDLRLPVAMLSMCTTYLIVIIQFTHLFD